MSDAAKPNERVAYCNGRILPEPEIAISPYDRGFRWGDGAYDMARTFRHRPFKLAEHVERLLRSLRYLGIDPGLTHGDFVRLSEEVLARNLHLLAPEDDYWIAQRVSRGLDPAGDEPPARGGPAVLIECCPLPLRSRAGIHMRGLDVLVSAIPRTPPRCLSPRAKTLNYLNHTLADREVRARDPNAWALFLDERGCLAEGTSSNVFLVKDGRLLTPQERFVLPGISRQTVLELAAALGIVCEERDLDLYDAANADEMFLTMTSACIAPVRSFEGAAFAPIPGAVTSRLLRAWTELVGCDFVAQFSRYAT